MQLQYKDDDDDYDDNNNSSNRKARNETQSGSGMAKLKEVLVLNMFMPNINGHYTS
jgi:hypothetical protein